MSSFSFLDPLRDTLISVLGGDLVGTYALESILCTVMTLLACIMGGYAIMEMGGILTRILKVVLYAIIAYCLYVQAHNAWTRIESNETIEPIAAPLNMLKETLFGYLPTLAQLRQHVI